MKAPLLLFSILLFSVTANSQTAKNDSIAVLLTDRMTDIIGELQSCSYTLNVEQDIDNPEFGRLQSFQRHEVFMSGPDKMLVNSNSPNGHRQYWYNGQQLAYYSHDENNYGILDAPPTTIGMIDHISQNYGIEFPAADFFYPAFTDDLLQNSDRLVFVGKAWIDEQECFHILASGKDVSVQFWISNDAFTLPKKLLITYHNQQGAPRYEATFSNWQVNPELPAAMFSFLPPPGAGKVRILSKKEK